MREGRGYPGGKGGAGVYQTIINHMPPHDVYVEAFAGSGAVLRWGSSRRPQHAALYDATTAKPKRQLTEKQRAALEAAQRSRRTCSVCHEDKGYVLEHRICDSCAERQRLAKIQQEVCNLLARDPLILDTETTDLDGYLVQIAVIDSVGNVLLDTLVNPQCEISEEAQAIHRITVEMLANAPTYADLEPRLIELLAGRCVAVYNAEFDQQILQNEIFRLHGFTTWRAATWLDDVKWRCVMTRYSVWVGDWSDYHGHYRWQPLPGGDHSALGDCQATLAVLREMAEYDPTLQGE